MRRIKGKRESDGKKSGAETRRFGKAKKESRRKSVDGVSRDLTGGRSKEHSLDGAECKDSRAAGGKSRFMARGRERVPSGAGQKERFLEGRICASGKGFAFLEPADGGEDYFIPVRNLHGAMHKDLVKTVVREASSGTRGGVVEVTKILERGVKTFVAKVVKKGPYLCLVPDDKRLGTEVDVMRSELEGAKENDKVVAAFSEYASETVCALGRVIEVLGPEYEVGVDILSVIREYGLYEEFPREVLDMAHNAPVEVEEAELAGRTDFRGQLIITIDGSDAKDLDDAVAVERTKEGYTLTVHIADVSRYVPEKTALDDEALRRGTSVYFPDRVLPMLPKELSNGICSLSEGVARLTTSCTICFDHEGERLSSKLEKGVICSKHRMTYEKVQAILDGEKVAGEEYPDLIEPLGLMEELMKKLLAVRNARGAIDLEIAEPKIILNPATGKIADVVAAPRFSSHRIIEEFMLAANEAVAERFAKPDLPFVYRIHEDPSEEKTDALSEFLRGLGIAFSPEGDILPQHIQDLITRAHGKPYERVVSQVTLRSLQKARYSEKCTGHFGLAAEYYCHFTSPIRRYPDLMIHRIIGAYLESGKAGARRYKDVVAKVAERSSEREVLAQRAERDVDDLKKAEYMAEHIGENFDGVVSGVTPFGLFVELENTVEGLLRIDLLPDPSYTVDEVHYVLRGKSTTYRLGDALRVKVISASKESRQVEFGLPDESVRPRERDAEGVFPRGGFEPEIKKMVMPTYSINN